MMNHFIGKPVGVKKKLKNNLYSESLWKSRCLFLLLDIFSGIKPLIYCVFFYLWRVMWQKHKSTTHSLKPFWTQTQRISLRERSNCPSGYQHENIKSKMWNTHLFLITCLNENMPEQITYRCVKYIQSLWLLHIKQHRDIYMWSIKSFYDELSCNSMQDRSAVRSP